jgi:hypothetical protein
MKLALAGSGCLVLALSTGCSDPPAQPAQGAASIFLQPRGGGNCPSATEIFVPASSSGYIKCNPNTSTCNPSKKVEVDGDGAEVVCAVRKSGDGYVLGGALRGDAGFSFSFSTAAPVSETGGTIAVSVRKALEDVPMGDADCTLTLHALEKGSMWGSYSCADIGEEAAPQPVCTAAGSFVFENCDT